MTERTLCVELNDLEFGALAGAVAKYLTELGVDARPAASYVQEQLSAAWAKIMCQWHPDLQGAPIELDGMVEMYAPAAWENGVHALEQDIAPVIDLFRKSD